MKSWKTTLFGLLAGIGEACKSSADPKIHALGNFLTPVAIYFLGHSAADHIAPPAAPADDKRQGILPGVGVILLAGVLFVSSGCSGLTGFAKAMAKDPNTASVNIEQSNPWTGTTRVNIARTGTTNSATAGNGNASVNAR